MPTTLLFPTMIWTAKAPPAKKTRWQKDILREAPLLAEIDGTGKKWSLKNYPNGYTSYSSLNQLPDHSSTFGDLRDWINKEVMKFAKTLEMDLQGRALKMSTCWINVMNEGASHSFHLHPLSVISGTYYIQVPKGAGTLKIEDPRIQSFMGSPPRLPKAKRDNLRYFDFVPQDGTLVLFESWLKHEVPANRSKTSRISVSFNYDWI